MVAGYAAKELAERGLKPGELTIVSAENALPYERPPLSKGFLAGKEQEEGIRINPPEFYDQREIQLRLGCKVAGVETARRRLRLRPSGELTFEKLIIATGAAVRTLDVGGADSPDVFYLRSLEDSKKIRARAEGAKRAVVVGSGFIGMEVASVLAQKGIETTMVVRESRIWERVFTPAMSRNFENYFAGGVRFVKEAEVQDVEKQRTLKISIRDGKVLECDLMVVGIGVRPQTGVLADSGIETGDGVMVNAYLETNVPGIYAAGDVANYEDGIFGKRRRVEHWDNAVSQGQYCARALTGERHPFVHVPYFFSDVFDLSYEFWGDPGNADEAVERGDPAGTSFSVWWIRDKRLVAAFVMNRPEDERNVAPRLIESRQRVTSVDLRAGKWPSA
jgi:NADPH-dependent 2,4-dienoyl-CoA reductase/sulfur reductase-like enzyme